MRRATTEQLAAVAHHSFEARATCAASKLDLKDLGRDERAFLSICQDLYRNDRGCGTPFENFVRKIIRWTTWGNPPKPEDLVDEIQDNFQPDWDLTVHSVKRFIHNYPEFVRDLQTKVQPARKPRKKVKRAA